MENRLYSTEQAGELLGMSAQEVLRHIHVGSLRPKRRPTARPKKRPDGTARTARPIYVVTSEEIQRYINSLPDATTTASQRGGRQRTSRIPTSIAAEIAACRQYV